MTQAIVIQWFTAAVAAGAVLLSIAYVTVRIGRLFHRLFRHVHVFLNRPLVELLIVAFCVGGFVQFGSTKGTNGVGRSGMTRVERNNLAATIIPVAVDVLPDVGTCEDVSIANLSFWGIEHDSQMVSLGIAWPVNTSFTNDCIDLFYSAALSSNGWIKLGQIDVGVARSNAVVEVDLDCLATNVIDHALFFRLASQDDADGDGLSNAIEDWVVGTDPWDDDTDGDGMPDGWEVDQGYDPLVIGESLDSDEDGLSDDLEMELGTDPTNADSDGDGLDDGDEYYAGSNPLAVDTDGDGLSDGLEFALGTNLSQYENFDVVNDDENTNIHTGGVDRLLTAPLRNGDASIFDGPQENTQTDGPDFEMQGQYAVSISYQGECTEGFSILGVSPMGGSTVRGNVTGGSWYSEDGPWYKNAFSMVALGVSFKALKTGFYAFQAHVDDSVVAQIGDKLSFSADYSSQNPGPMTNALFIAGETCPVSIAASSIGGPAELSFPVWGAFTPIAKPQVAVKLSAPTVIFEDAYQNIPGVPGKPRRSTDVDVKIGIRGGGLGGTLSLTSQNGNRLRFVSGDGCLSGSYAISAGETRYLQGTYEGVLASSTTNDVVIVATFTESSTGIVTSYTNSLTVIRIQLTADNVAPLEADRHRHVYGVGELVNYAHVPIEAEVSWQFNPQGEGWQEFTVTNTSFRCPYVLPSLSDMLVANAQVSYKEVSFRTAFKVYRPRVIARNPRINGGHTHVSPVIGEAGHLLLCLDLYAAPLYVSFVGLDIRETPDESQSGGHDGYYDDIDLGGPWSHTALAGAGRWLRVATSGLFATDEAGRKDRYEQPWSNGWKEWPIPMEYGMAGASMGIILPNPVTTQRFELDANGTFVIKKHGNMARRNKYGIKWKNGKPTW